MNTYKLDGIEFMGENVKDKLRSCGRGCKNISHGKNCLSPRS